MLFKNKVELLLRVLIDNSVYIIDTIKLNTSSIMRGPKSEQ